MTKPASDADPINGFFSEGGGRRGAHIRAGSEHRASTLAKALPMMRPGKEPKTARARISARKEKPTKLLGPTPERAAKGDVTPYRTAGGFHRSISTVERLRDQGKLDHDARHNQAMFQAAERLRRHFDGCQIGVKAQDLNRITGGAASGDLTQEEAWVEHHRHFTIAKKLMGWTEAHPKRGSACIVIAVVCEEMTVSDAADTNLPQARTEAMKAAAMDRLREGLFMLAVHWREI